MSPIFPKDQYPMPVWIKGNGCMKETFRNCSIASYHPNIMKYITINNE
jgi:hypothetical protein